MYDDREIPAGMLDQTRPLLIKNARDESLIFHYMMLTRQMTELANCFTHIARLPSNGGEHKGVDFKGYRAYAQTELADIMCQTEKLCEILGLDFEQTIDMGRTRDVEKKAEYLSKHPNDRWI